MAGATFKAEKGTSFGFTDESGKQQERKATDGTITARNGFEERLFGTSFGLERVEEPAKPKSATKRSKAKSSTKAAGSSAPAAEKNETEPATTPTDEEK